MSYILTHVFDQLQLSSALKNLNEKITLTTVCILSHFYIKGNKCDVQSTIVKQLLHKIKIALNEEVYCSQSILQSV